MELIHNTLLSKTKMLKTEMFYTLNMDDKANDTFLIV